METKIYKITFQDAFSFANDIKVAELTEKQYLQSIEAQQNKKVVANVFQNGINWNFIIIGITSVILIGEKNDFKVYFDSNNQEYFVMKGKKYLIGNKFKFSEVESYLK